MIAREIGDQRGKGIASWNLGLVYVEMKEWEKGADLMQVRVDYERSIVHPDTKKHEAEVVEIRKKIHGGGA